MKTLAKYHVSNRFVIGEKTFKNILIGPDNLPGLSRNGPQTRRYFLKEKADILPRKKNKNRFSTILGKFYSSNRFSQVWKLLKTERKFWEHLHFNRMVKTIISVNGASAKNLC